MAVGDGVKLRQRSGNRKIAVASRLIGSICAAILRYGGFLSA